MIRWPSCVCASTAIRDPATEYFTALSKLVTDGSDECLAQLIGLRAHARFADRMSDAEPLERCGCVRQDRIDTHAQFVGPFLRFTSEINGDDSEFAILR